MMSGREKAPTLGQGIVILLPLACYPVIDFVFRIANGIVAPDLSAEFYLNAADLGLVSSVFFIAFSSCTHPLPSRTVFIPWNAVSFASPSLL